MHELQRITTTFVDSEDRIRLCGEAASNQTVVLWLTQRLLNRLVPHLLAWLEQQTSITGGVGSDVRADVVNSFAQQAALASLAQQPPVQAHAAQTVWLVQSVDMTTSADAIRLTFNDSPTSGQQRSNLQACLSMQALPLRQWLSILHEQCQRAGWVSAPPHAASDIWPEWIQARQGGSRGTGVLWH